jgi:peroxiredoxin
VKGKRFLAAAIFAIAAFLVGGNLVTAKSGIKVGDTMESFSLPDLDGKMHSLDSLKGEKGAVVVFLSAQCPVVKGYNERFNQIAADYKAKGINFIGINSNSTEDLNWVKSDAEKVGYKFPVLIDKGNALADKLGANVTPEVYFVDAKNVLLYHGAIDDSRSGKDIKINYLRTAFDDSLAGKKIERNSANAFGCSIKRAQ